jgi:hypothetical protein
MIASVLWIFLEYSDLEVQTLIKHESTCKMNVLLTRFSSSGFVKNSDITWAISGEQEVKIENQGGPLDGSI